MNPPRLSIIVPIYNEAGNIAELHSRIINACKAMGSTFEIIFIDDGSKDQGIEEMKSCKPLTIIKFRKNFGQTSAFDAGIKSATGDLIVTMDGDLQNDPADIPIMIKKLKEGFDVVCGWRKQRNDPFMKRFISRVANMLRQVLIADGIHDSGCSLKVIRRSCFEGVDLHGEMHRFIPAVLKLKGFRITEVEVTHHPRTKGQTKYNWKRAIKGILDMVSVWFWKKFASRPLHLFGSVGMLSALVSLTAGAIAAYGKFVHDRDLSETALTELAMFSFLMGVQFLMFGLIADMLAKQYYATGRERTYYIDKIINTEDCAENLPRTT